MSNLRNYDSNKFSWFVLIGQGLDKVNRGGSHSFKGYSDHADAHGKGPGAYIQYVTSKDDKGRAVGKYFTFDESRRRFQVRFGEQDINQITQFNFLKFSPDCEGSPNGVYTEVDGIRVQEGIMFRELNTDKDAEIALEAESRRTQAQASALQLDEATLQELAAFIGVYGKPGDLMKLKVLEWAGKRPGDYFELLNSGDRSVRALVKKALADNVFTKKGEVIFWESTVIGSNEDDAVGTLMREHTMRESLAKKINLADTSTVKTQIKSKGGRPPGSKNKAKSSEIQL